MRNIVAGLKLLYFCCSCSLYILFGLPFTFLIDLFPIGVRRVLIRNIQFGSTLVLIPFGIKKKVIGNLEALKSKEPKFIVGNHQTYLDMVILSSIHPACYVTSVEVKETPGLGFLSKLGGALYVERRDKSNIANEIKELTNGLKSGLDICVFPEATSTNGEEVIRFRRPLFNAPLMAKKQILPLSISYQFLDGKKVTTNNRDFICWYGDMEFFPHFWNFLKCKSVEVEVKIGNPITPENDWDVAQLALVSHEQVTSMYTPISIA